MLKGRNTLDIIDRFPALKNFDSICNFIEQHNPTQILQKIATVYKLDPQKLATMPMGGYSRLLNADGSFSKGNGCYFFV